MKKTGRQSKATLVNVEREGRKKERMKREKESLVYCGKILNVICEVVKSKIFTIIFSEKMQIYLFTYF